MFVPNLTSNFTRTKEDFVCESCGFEVVGNGYTNHCPQCLTSKHVDIVPGDRRSPCGGIMSACEYETKSGEDRLVFKCDKCGFVRANRVGDKDNRQKIIDISKKPFLC